VSSQESDSNLPPGESIPAAQPQARAPAERLWRELRDALSGIHIPGALAATVSTAALIVSHHHGNTGTYRRAFGGLIRGEMGAVAPYLYWFSASVALYLLLPLIAAALTPGIKVRQTGIGLGDWRTGLAATAAVLLVFLPVVFVASRVPAFADHYPLCSGARNAWSLFLVYELAYAAYFIAWEYMYRGYLLFSLEQSMGKMAVFAQMMPFAIIHFGKPEAETFGAIIAGIFLGLLALRTRSFWYGAIIHIAVAVTMDLLTAWGPLTALSPG
jgi:membrane protease YdiL (CAAX protease family)